jgi:hypothetical protein
METRDFETLLDRFGSDLSRWSDAAQRRSAEVLLASSAEARVVLTRAVRLAALVDSVETPPPPSLESIIERATGRGQMSSHPPRALARTWGVPPGWLGLGQWHAWALVSCLIFGIVVGVGTAGRADYPDAVYDMVDGSHIEGFHE